MIRGYHLVGTPNFQRVIPVKKQLYSSYVTALKKFHLFNITFKFTIDENEFLAIGLDTMLRKKLLRFLTLKNK